MKERLLCLQTTTSKDKEIDKDSNDKYDIQLGSKQEDQRQELEYTGLEEETSPEESRQVEVEGPRRS